MLKLSVVEFDIFTLIVQTRIIVFVSDDELACTGGIAAFP